MAVVEAREGFSDGGIPWLARGDVDGCADANEGEGFRGGLERHAHATEGRGMRFHKAPVETVGRFELHPIRHRVACAWTAETAAVGLF